MLNFFLPMAICLFLCVVLLYMETKKKQQALTSHSFTKRLLDELLNCILQLCISYYKMKTFTFYNEENYDAIFNSFKQLQLQRPVSLSTGQYNITLYPTWSLAKQMTHLHGIKSGFTTD